MGLQPDVENLMMRRPIHPIHPGEVLAEQLAVLNLTAASAARDLHVPPSRIYQLLAGKRAMTADTALRLEWWLGVSAAFWMNLQMTYKLDCASEEIGAEIQRTVRPRRPEQSATPAFS